jgi:hydrogenase maturation protease
LNANEGLAGILPAKARILVIGVGNEYRSDDAVGLVVARRLRRLSLENVKVIEESGEGADLLESWEGANTVIIVDAASSGAKPGTIHCIDARAKQIPRGLLHYSTHAFSVGEAVELARVMGRLPPHILVYGVEGARFEEGMALSGAVEESVSVVVGLVLKEVRASAPR